VVVTAGACGTGAVVPWSVPSVWVWAWDDGSVPRGAVVSSATDGLRLACMMCCIGAANTLANPKRARAAITQGTLPLIAVILLAIGLAA